jgi:hypothetical protein
MIDPFEKNPTPSNTHKANVGADLSSPPPIDRPHHGLSIVLPGTDFLHQHPLETRGAMINAELLYKLKRAGYTYREVGIHHLPRQGGRATGANPRVIARAFRELFHFTREWRREERAQTQRALVSEHHPF